MGAALMVVLGLFVGGIANVAVDRLPPVTDEDIAALHGERGRRTRRRPGDRRRPLAWWEVLPILSFFGAVRRPRVAWSNGPLRYPAVEAAAAGAFALSWLRFDGEPFGIGASAAFAAVLIALAFMDFETRYLPDVVVIPMGVAALIVSPFWTHLVWWEGLAGAGIGFCIFLPIVWISERLGREWMGGGDVKLLAALGGIVGWQMLLLGMYLGVLVGGVVAVVLFVAGRRGVIAYGPYLILGGLAALYYGRAVLDWVIGSTG